jgi:hypothetical protein
VAKVQAHNAEYLAGRVGWTMAVNGFADMTALEFKERFTSGMELPLAKRAASPASDADVDVKALPPSVGAYNHGDSSRGVCSWDDVAR